MPYLKVYGFANEVTLVANREHKGLKRSYHCTQGAKMQLRVALGRAQVDVYEEIESEA